MLIKHLSISFPPNYCKDFVAKNNTSSRDLSTFRRECLNQLDHWSIW